MRSDPECNTVAKPVDRFLQLLPRVWSNFNTLQMLTKLVSRVTLGNGRQVERSFELYIEFVSNEPANDQNPKDAPTVEQFLRSLGQSLTELD